MSLIKVSDYIVRFLEQQGVKHVFMVSGGGCIHIVDSLGKSEIDFVCNLHEQGSAICAESYGQYTNNLGVALVTTGPGGTNAITGIAGAWLDSTPMLVICGQVQQKDRVNNKKVRQLGFQEIDMVGLTEKITKFSYTITDPKSIRYYLEKAVFIAKDSRPGPVLLEIPLDVQSTWVEQDELESYICAKLTPYIDHIVQDDIYPLLLKSKKPIILVGNGVRLSNGINEFHEFINKTHIPVLTTWKALDILEEDHHLFVGRPGAIGQRGANINQQNADLILCIGARLDHGQIAYQPKYFGPNAVKIIVDIDNNEINKNFEEMINVVKCHSDAKKFLYKLNKITNPEDFNTSEWLTECKSTYLKYPVILPEYYKESGYVNAYTFIGELSNQLPENSLIIPGSSGTCSEVTMQAIQIKKGTRVYNTEGLGSMGFGIPAAIGGCLASGCKKTICIDGDGGFFMNIQELEVVKRLNLPIIFFVLNNQGYGSIRTTQNNHFKGHVVASDKNSGMTLPDIASTAYGYAIDVIRINNNSEIEKILNFTLTYNGPLICEVIMNPNHQTLPRTTVFKNKEGNFETAPMEIMIPKL